MFCSLSPSLAYLWRVNQWSIQSTWKRCMQASLLTFSPALKSDEEMRWQLLSDDWDLIWSTYLSCRWHNWSSPSLIPANHDQTISKVRQEKSHEVTHLGVNADHLLVAVGEGGELQSVPGQSRGQTVPPPSLTASLARPTVTVSAAPPPASGGLELREHPAQAGRSLATGITDPWVTVGLFWVFSPC